MLPSVSNIKTKIINGINLADRLLQQFIRLAQGKQIIHVIGDSHSLLFQSPLFKIHYIGPATAHNLISDKSQTKSNQLIQNILDNLDSTENNSTFILLVFGEIDSRIHIYNTHKQKNIPISIAVENTVQQYSKYIINLKDKYPNFIFMIFNVVPAGEQDNVYNYPHYADREVRQEITKLFNQALKNELAKNGTIFIECFNELLDQKGQRKTEYVFDKIHYNNKILPIVVTDLKQKMVNFKW